MTRNLKALGLALLAVFALSAIGAQVASAADSHEFHSEVEKTIITGKNVGPHEFTVGTIGTVKCEEATFESTVVGTKANEAGNTWAADEITVRPTYKNCTFGGQLATVYMNDCDYKFDSETTEGNTTGGKHANVKIECAAGHKIEIHTVNCTITVAGAPAQEIKHAVSYKNETASATETIATAHGIVVGKERNTESQPVNGCLLFPTGAVGKYKGTSTNECRLDEHPGTGTETTPANTQDATTKKCTVTDI